MTSVCPKCDSFMKGNFCKCGYKVPFEPEKSAERYCSICGKMGRAVHGRYLGHQECKGNQYDRVLCYDCYQRHYAWKGFTRCKTTIYGAELVRDSYNYHRALFYDLTPPAFYSASPFEE